MDESDRDEQEIALLLRVAGARDPLPPDLKDRWEAHFRSELATLQARNKSGNRVKLGRILALCAMVTVMALGLTLLPDFEVDSPESRIQLVHFSGDVRIISDEGERLTITVGGALAANSEIQTGPSALVALRYNDHELRINADSHLRLGRESLTLWAGELYATDAFVPMAFETDKGKGSASLQIDTAQGSVIDIGTQFTVAMEGEETRATVRQGAIRVRSGNVERTLQAPDGAALQTILAAGRAIEVNIVASRGKEWQWINRAAPSYELDGSSALDFLRWAARESGLQLRFTTATAERYAERTILRGNLQRLNPEEAVEPILAGTDLTARVSDAGELIVTLLR